MRWMGNWRRCAAISLALVCGLGPAAATLAQVVPGTGTPVTGGGDDFENPDWSYDPKLPKNSNDLDERSRPPEGRSPDGKWYEGNGRGTPDVVRRVPTPPDGLEGSTGSLLIQSKFTGVPGRPTGKAEQDDLYMGLSDKPGSFISASRTPNFTVRVWLPPFEEWSPQSGSTFAVRATLRGPKPGTGESKPYWPGLFFEYHPGKQNRDGKDFAMLVLRGNEMGQDYFVRKITEAGCWWTLGMSFTPDGRVHFYAREGVDPLTSADHLASHWCYGFRCQTMFDVFFDVWNRVDGQSVSTAWIIDDPQVFVSSDRTQVTRQPSRRVR